ncbi:MAG: pitrilysin family protein [bacterium]|jgi:zinc protease|nr:insulinase family protein [candidate division KSB1 bacterium]MDH7559044.1 pitrilysin family protein [bacterium]
MKSFALPALALLMFLVACGPQKRLEVVTLPVASDQTISIRLWFKVGSQNDPSGKEGLAALTAQMIADASTKKNGYEQILEKLYPMAAGYSAQVDKEMTIIMGRVHKDNLDAYYKLFVQAVLEPAFREDDFARLKSQQLNYLERTLRYQDDEELGKEALSQFIFAGTPYAHPVAGLIESAKSITLDDVRAFYRKYYTKDNVVVGIGGSFDKRFADRLCRDLARLPAGAPEQPDPPQPAPIKGLQVLLIEKDTESTAISFGFPLDIVRGAPDFHALWLVNSWLGEHRNSSSHLYQVIREARGMNYGDYSYIEAFPRGSRLQFPPSNVARRQQIFQIWIRPVRNEARHFALRAAVRELQKLVDNGLNQEAFELTAQFLKKYYLHFAPTTMERLGYALDDVFYGLDENFLNQFPKHVDELTLPEVNAAAGRHLQDQNMKIVMVTKDAEALKEALVANAPSPIRYATPKPQAVLEEDKEIAVYRLPVRPENVQVVKVEQMFLR